MEKISRKCKNNNGLIKFFDMKIGVVFATPYLEIKLLHFL